VPESNHSRDNYVQPIFSVDVIVVNPFYFDGTLNEKRKGMEVRVSMEHIIAPSYHNGSSMPQSMEL
jgi:hypothetical protein